MADMMKKFAMRKADGQKEQHIKGNKRHKA
jgi:hypothetical protein